MSNYQRTAAWLKACGKEPGNEDQFSVQLGVDLEEFIEGLACIELDLPADAMNEASAAIALLADVAVLLKARRGQGPHRRRQARRIPRRPVRPRSHGQRTCVPRRLRQGRRR